MLLVFNKYEGKIKGMPASLSTLIIISHNASRPKYINFATLPYRNMKSIINHFKGDREKKILCPENPSRKLTQHVVF